MKNTSDEIHIVEYMTAGIETRKECLELAFDRGLGSGMKIENWILTEMLAKLVQLRDNGTVESVEGEHKYPKKKSTRFEHCDLWWKINGKEHWLEVKTVKVEKDIGEVSKDLEKNERLREDDIFHHLSIVFSGKPMLDDRGEKLNALYKQKGLSNEADWVNDIDENRGLRFMLYVRP
jgi:hypothetical protein